MDALLYVWTTAVSEFGNTGEAQLQKITADEVREFMPLHYFEQICSPDQFPWQLIVVIKLVISLKFFLLYLQ